MHYNYKSWLLDSEEELFFCYWLEELKENGFIDSFERVTDSMSVYEPFYYEYYKKTKKGPKLAKKILTRKLTYTADFQIKWNKKADGIFVMNSEGLYPEKHSSYFHCIPLSNFFSIVDVKGTFKNPKVHTSVTFPIIQKILLSHGCYVQDVIPLGDKGLFAKTFTPKKYLLTNTGKQRKIKWKVYTLEEFINKYKNV
jgi:hypothetical protein